MRDSILFNRPDPALLLRSRHQHKRQHGREALIRAVWQRFECELEVIIAHLNEVLQMHGSVEDNASRQQRSWQDRPRFGPRIPLVRSSPARARRLDFLVLTQRSNGIATMRRWAWTVSSPSNLRPSTPASVSRRNRRPSAVFAGARQNSSCRTGSLTAVKIWASH
jgi:hypothetical protein